MYPLKHTIRGLKDLRPAVTSRWWFTCAPRTSTGPAYRLNKSSQSRSLSATTSRGALGDDTEVSRHDPAASQHERSGHAATPLGGALGNNEITRHDPARKDSGDEIQHAYARPVPVSPSYFSRHPKFNDSYVMIQDLARKYVRLPTLPKDEVPLVAWRTKEQYRLIVGEHVKGRDYAECMKLVKRLHQIHPDLMPGEVVAGLQSFKRDINPYLNKAKIIPVDKFGRSQGVGRRKTSMARAYLVEGTGEVLVNGKPLNEAFGRLHDRESAVWALKASGRLDKYNVWAQAEGGGTTGQAEAMAMAVAKALVVHEPALKTPLRKAGCLTRDPRMVERKKHGRLKARKMPAWVKR